MITFDEACRRIAGIARPLGMETVPLEMAWNRVLATPVVAAHMAPCAAVSAMDGYAVRDADIRAGTNRLRVVGEAFAGPGGHDRPLEPGECVRIFTGARLPLGADRVLIQENVQAVAGEVCFEGSPGGARHVRAAGSDFAPGDVLLEAGTPLSPQALVTAAAADCGTLQVFRRPRVAILSTGDELVSPGHAAELRGAVPESVSFGVCALVRAWGGEVVGRRRLGDDLAALRSAARAALDEADVVVTTGGASVGERDHSKTMFTPFGMTCVFEKVAIKPGKPVWVGKVGDRIVVGLPGNPSAAMVTARLVLAPLLAGLSGRSPASALAWRTATLGAGLGDGCDRETFLRARTGPEGVRSLGSQDSSAQRGLAATELLIRRPAHATALDAGAAVDILAF
ncbi:molybdopterin molybdotransferase MoeA [Phenylobacterium sp.]|uniref:molybdopterin molybdotransferase MoeA n=1 Tax=Phenylobacterium sp. TaxID=1871053 RepID=UPI002EDA3942